MLPGVGVAEPTARAVQVVSWLLIMVGCGWYVKWVSVNLVVGYVMVVNYW